MTSAVLTLVGSIGWGLLGCGAITHVWHHKRLRSLLARHIDHERIPALLLTTLELVLVVGIAMAVRWSGSWLTVFAVAALVVAVGFMVWIARLLLTGSNLPCACSFSEAPTTWWSFGRACCVALVACFAVLDHSAYTASSSAADTTATMLVGWACAAAIFVVPEALSWPETSRALLARGDAYTSTEALRAAP